MMITQNQPVLKPSEFDKFQHMLYVHAGIHLNASKHALVQNRLRKRLRILDLNDYSDYFEHIVNPAHSAEFQECLNALTTNETYFFRHKNHWDFFTGEFIREIRARQSLQHAKSVRIWSAAASIGAEAYSAAIALAEHFGMDGDWQLTIDATDLNEEVLEQAREGRFVPYAVQKLTPHCLSAYFHHDKGRDEYVVREDLRRMVRFRRYNLLDALHAPAYDLVFLRNVLIYFDEASKERVVRNVADCIHKGGYLILGGAESLSTHRDMFEYIKPTIFRKIG